MDSKDFIVIRLIEEHIRDAPTAEAFRLIVQNVPALARSWFVLNFLFDALGDESTDERKTEKSNAFLQSLAAFPYPVSSSASALRAYVAREVAAVMLGHRFTVSWTQQSDHYWDPDLEGDSDAMAEDHEFGVGDGSIKSDKHQTEAICGLVHKWDEEYLVFQWGYGEDLKRLWQVTKDSYIPPWWSDRMAIPSPPRPPVRSTLYLQESEPPDSKLQVFRSVFALEDCIFVWRPPRAYIQGIVTNVGSRKVRFVGVSGAVRDSAGKLLGTDAAPIRSRDLAPGQRGCFEIHIRLEETSEPYSAEIVDVSGQYEDFTTA